MMTNDDSIEAFNEQCGWESRGNYLIQSDSIKELVVREIFWRRLAMKYREVLQTISEQSYDEAEELAPDYAHEVLALTKKDIEDLK